MTLRKIPESPIIAIPPSRFTENAQLAFNTNLIKSLRTGLGDLIRRFNSHTDEIAFNPVPEFRYLTAPTYTVQTGFYIQLGPIVHFRISLAWSSLDTADASVVSVRLPVFTGMAIQEPFMGHISDRASTGIDLSGLTVPVIIDLAADGTSMGISKSNATRLTYNGGEMQASGTLEVAGSFWLA